MSAESEYAYASIESGLKRYNQVVDDLESDLKAARAEISCLKIALQEQTEELEDLRRVTR